MNSDEIMEELQQRQSIQIKKAKIQFNKDWSSFIEKEFEGENTVYYIMKLKSEVMDTLKNVQFTVVSHQDRDINEYDYAEINLKFVNQSHEYYMNLHYYPGIQDSDDENERMDYYELNSSNLPFSLDEGEESILSDIFDRFNLSRKTLNYNNLMECLLDEYTSKEEELYQQDSHEISYEQ